MSNPIGTDELLDRIEERDETFALMLDRAQTAEAKLAKAVELDTVIILVTAAYKEGWSDSSEFASLDVGWEKSLTRATLAELERKP